MNISQEKSLLEVITKQKAPNYNSIKILTKYKDKQNNPIYITNKGPSRSIKYLGLHINLNLNWKEHLREKFPQFQDTIKEINNLYIPPFLKSILYNSVALPKILFGICLMNVSKDFMSQINKTGRALAKRSAHLSSIKNEFIHLNNKLGGGMNFNDAYLIQHTRLINTFYRFLTKNNDKLLTKMIISSFRYEDKDPNTTSIINLFNNTLDNLNWKLELNNKPKSIPTNSTPSKKQT